MSEHQAASNAKIEQARQYLRLAFQKNPMWESEQLLDLRRKTFRIAKAVAEPKVTMDPQAGKKRDAMRRAVDKIQHEFWTLPLEELQRKVSAIDIKEAPDVAGVVKRLRTAAMCRSEFPKLASAKGMHLPLFHAFKTAVVLPPSEAGYVREQFLRSIEDRKQLKTIKRSIGIIQKEYPVLYALEKDWFKTIRETKAPPRERAEQGSLFEGADFSGAGVVFSWPFIFFLLMLFRVLARLASSSD